MQFIDLVAQQTRLGPAIQARIQAVLSHGEFLMGPEIQMLENALSAFCGVRYCAAVASGADALLLSLTAFGVGKGDAVFCPSFAPIAIAEAPSRLGATPVFVDIDPTYYTLCPESLARTIDHARSQGLRPAATITEDAFGVAAPYDLIEPICHGNGMKLVVGGAHGFGASYKGRIMGALGDAGAVSFKPSASLGCWGDGGAVLTDDREAALLLRSLRDHGRGDDPEECVRIGMSSRMDTIQAAVLLEKLEVYTEELLARHQIAQRYEAGLNGLVDTPKPPLASRSAWARYAIGLRPGQNRDEIQAALWSVGAPSTPPYRNPLHHHTAFRDNPIDPNGLPITEAAAAHTLCLPMHAYLGEQDQNKVIQVLRTVLK